MVTVFHAQTESRIVDFDFGDRGEVDGIDIWKVAYFARGALSEYGFSSESQLKAAFEAAVEAGEFHRRGDLYYVGRHAA